MLIIFGCHILTVNLRVLSFSLSWRMDQHKANKYGNYLDLLVFGKGFVKFELVIVNQIINEYLFQNFELFFICF